MNAMNDVLDRAYVPEPLAVGQNEVPTKSEVCAESISLLNMAGDHPLATYVREVADSIQISRDSTFMIGLGLTSAVAEQRS